jgi:hypothetical protein
VSKELLIFGDSNVERNIPHAGLFYRQYTETVAARNITEFNSALGKARPDKYKSVVFAMFTNIVVNAGSTVTQDLASRLTSVEACLRTVVRSIT